MHKKIFRQTAIAFSLLNLYCQAFGAAGYLGDNLPPSGLYTGSGTDSSTNTGYAGVELTITSNTNLTQVIDQGSIYTGATVSSGGSGLFINGNFTGTLINNGRLIGGDTTSITGRGGHGLALSSGSSIHDFQNNGFLLAASAGNNTATTGNGLYLNNSIINTMTNGVSGQIYGADNHIAGSNALFLNNGSIISRLDNLGEIIGGDGTTSRGGAGISVESGGSITVNNSGTIRGGKGNGTTSSTRGGHGIYIDGSSAYIYNTGTISGGDNNNVNGEGGRGVTFGSNMGSSTLINAGVISSGLNGDGATYSRALNITASVAHTIELQTNGRFIGDIYNEGVSIGHAFSLNSTAATGYNIFNLSQLTGYWKNTVFNKIGLYDWILEGTTTGNNNTTNWQIDQGNLVVGASANGTHINGIVAINNGGILSGYGSVGQQVTANTGATISPGYNSIGMLTFHNNYIGNDALLLIDTVLGDDSSSTDKLVIDGTASGNTYVKVNNIGGLGAQTNNGIEVIVTGTSGTDTFIQHSAIAAGTYEYVLVKGQNNQNWYLTSVLKEEPGGDPLDPIDPPTKPEQPDIVLRNPSIGAYLANQTAASALFIHTLYDRQGHANNVAGNSQKNSSIWLRASTRNTKNKSINGSMNIDTDSSIIHLGGDIAKWQLQEGNLNLGVMGAYGQTESDVRSKYTGTAAKGKVTGYSVGLYGTWFADEAQGKGLYLDSWAQYGWYKNKVTGEAQANNEEKYDSNNWAASLEAGYGFHLATQGNTEMMLTPQVQVTYKHYRADDHNDGNHIEVRNAKANGLVTRIGARLYGRVVEGYSVKPFIETNWLHHTTKNELSFNGEVFKDEVPKNRLESKLGLQGTISKNWKLWGQVGAQWGGNNYTRYEGQAGLNYQW
ncbi:autotransporter outer membrane beta-barrel domain-containing protein [Neisseria sp. Ec49-e6-T10]|uniref:autotransporter family protein n=1 Tax=Neisseria sp. Ec49-e6-T10 TaxID=3140744 RepID=UPI003EBFD2E0